MTSHINIDTNVEGEQKKVDLPSYDNVPQWLVIKGELDLRLYILEEMLKKDRTKSAIHKMVDQATGYDKELTTQAQELIAECRWLKQEFDKEYKYE